MTKTTEAAGTPEEKSSSIIYNVYGQQETLVKPDGNSIHYTYEGFGRLKTCTSSDGSVNYFYTYNLLDQITSVLDRRTGQVTTREYFQEELKKETLSNGLSIEYTYDGTGRVFALKLPDQTSIEYVYNAVNLKEIHRVINDKRVYTHHDLEYSLSGQMTRAVPPGKNGAITYRFDPLDRCIAIKSEAFNQQIPEDGFDSAGNLLKCNIQSIPYAFSYDDHYNISKETGPVQHSYTFDSVANRTAKDGEMLRYNALNQLIQKGEQSLEYDRNGNLERNGLCAYAYDALDRLIKVSFNGTDVTYAYDAFNRRVSRNKNGEEELFLYQGLDEIGRWKNGVCQECRLLGKNPSSRTVALEIRGKCYVPLHDIRGNIATLVDFQGNVVEKYRYSVFGEREILSPSGEKRQQSAVSNPWQYSGKRSDEESGLIAFGMRYYSPSLGRWITPDPADFIDGTNLYAYVHNNPLLYLDQYGLFGEFIFQPLQDFEWKHSFRDFSQSIETTIVDTWDNPYFQGSMQALGGLAEASLGAGMTYSTGGLAAPAGCVVMAHGLDHFFTGINTVINGRYDDTITSQLLEMGGVSPQTANTIDSIISMGGSMGAAKCAMNAACSAFPQTIKSAGQLPVQEVRCVTKGGSGKVRSKKP